VRGIVWGINQTPTINDNFGSTSNGTGTGSFTSNLSNLMANTTYYVRAYATNLVGTSYGNQYSFTTALGSNPGAGVNYDGYTYSTIVLGNGQEWMAENLRTNVYSNGDPIPNVIDNTQWENLTTGAWVHYNNNISFENPYGKLYNWYAVSDPRNLCPIGWHVPTSSDWVVLTNYFGGYLMAGGKMKSTGTQYWLSPNTGATNESGFSGLPGGERDGVGSFGEIGEVGYWWHSTEHITYTPDAYINDLRFSIVSSGDFHFSKELGLSVRCLRD